MNGTIIAELRARAVAEAKSWIGTPYVEGGRVKGAGCDCATLIAEVLVGAGITEREEIGFYGRDWWANGGEEKYMFRLLRHARKTLEGISFYSLAAQPGDIVLVRQAGSKLYNHGGIVTKWPRLVDSVPGGVREVNAAQCCFWANQNVAVLDPYAKNLETQAETAEAQIK